MLATVTWLARLAACVLIGVLTFVTAPPTGADLALEIAGYVISLATIGYWLMIDLHVASAAHVRLPVVMGAMAVVAGVLSVAPHGGALIGFSIIAVLAAGADTGWLAGWVIAAIAVLSIQIGALVFGTAADDVWSYPLVLIVAFIGGRNRRAYVLQAEQSAAMLTQLDQLRSEQRRVAVLDERNRIAREIHDVLAHSLGALGIQLQATRAVLDNDDVERARGLLEQAQRMATDGLVDTRRAVQALRGDSTRLDEQLATLIETHRDRHRTAIDFQLEGEPAGLLPEASVALIRTAQEALVNTAKHAPHQPVEIRLTYGPDQVSLAITNSLATSDGQGADTGAMGETPAFSSVNGGYGLVGMRERLLLINGSLTTGSNDHRWTVRAQVPR
jgi:signal transduction histidine kinase